ncbi:MAG: ABC transporter ATP-binding protein [bacterium]|nr:ABC transporter ATP-binding protein [bacterium]MCP4799062.1 ABC transporter ATP-binding protein [bacterium]
MTYLLEAKNIIKTFDRQDDRLTVLNNCSLGLESGESISITGRSGSGKSTLLNVISGLDNSDSGELIYNGTDITSWTLDQFAIWRRENIGFVFQFHFLLPDFTAYENIMIPSRIANKSAGSDEKFAMELLDHLGLADRKNHLPGELSGGEQQRIAIARAFINKPAILLADEPFGNLDAERGEQLTDMLFNLANMNQSSIIIVTHDKMLAARTDRSLELDSGNLTAII